MNVFKIITLLSFLPCMTCIPLFSGIAHVKEGFGINFRQFNEPEAVLLIGVKQANIEGIKSCLSVYGKYLRAEALIKAFEIAFDHKKKIQLAETLMQEIITNQLFVGNKALFQKLCNYFVPQLSSMNCSQYISTEFFEKSFATNKLLSSFSEELKNISSAGKHFIQCVLYLSDEPLFYNNTLLQHVLRVFLLTPRYKKIELMCHVLLYACLIKGFVCKMQNVSNKRLLKPFINVLHYAYLAKNELSNTGSPCSITIPSFELCPERRIFVPLLFEIPTYQIQQSLQSNAQLGFEICLNAKAYDSAESMIHNGFDLKLLQKSIADIMNKNGYDEWNILFLIKYDLTNNFQSVIKKLSQHTNTAKLKEFLEIMHHYFARKDLFFEECYHPIIFIGDSVRNRIRHLSSYLSSLVQQNNSLTRCSLYISMPTKLSDDVYSEIAAAERCEDFRFSHFENLAYACSRYLCHYKALCAALSKKKIYAQALANHWTDIKFIHENPVKK